MHKVASIVNGKWAELEYRFKIGDKVSFLFINKEDGYCTFVRDSKVTNSWFQDPTLQSLLLTSDPTYKRYYFCNVGDSVQGVWVPENQVFERNEESIAEILFGEIYVSL